MVQSEYWPLAAEGLPPQFGSDSDFSGHPWASLAGYNWVDEVDDLTTPGRDPPTAGPIPEPSE